MNDKLNQVSLSQSLNKMDELKKANLKCSVCNEIHEFTYHPSNEYQVLHGGYILLCDDCDKQYWIDPAGGLHNIDEEDPAKMYEQDSQLINGGTLMEGKLRWEDLSESQKEWMMKRYPDVSKLLIEDPKTWITNLPDDFPLEEGQLRAV